MNEIIKMLLKNAINMEILPFCDGSGDILVKFCKGNGHYSVRIEDRYKPTDYELLIKHALEGLIQKLEQKTKEKLKPGAKYYVICPSMMQAESAFRHTYSIARAHGLVSASFVRDSYIGLEGQIDITFVSCNSDKLQGVHGETIQLGEFEQMFKNTYGIELNL